MLPTRRAEQNRAVTNGADDRRTPRAPGSGRGRTLLALAVSLVATTAVSLPLAYQAAGADDVSERTPRTTEPQPASVLPTVLERSGPDIRWQATSATGPAEPLQGAVLSGRVRISLDQPRAVEARFWIDDLDPRRAPDDVDSAAPFSLETERARATQPTAATSSTGTLDTRRLRNGLNAVLVRVGLDDGTSMEQIVTFIVTNPR